VFDEIVQINETGLIIQDGKHHQADIIVCATGFATQFVPHFPIYGRDGRLFQEESRKIGPLVYMGITAPNLPNYFVINGPRGNWAQGTALSGHEVQIEYIMQCVQKIQRECLRFIEVKLSATEEINEHFDEWHKGSVWTEPCKR